MLNIKKHRQFLFNILVSIYKQPWSDYLGFKGGTMAYFFYDLDRFSVDLDFDLLEDKSIKKIEDKMPAVLSSYGKIKDMRNKYFTLFYLLDYQSGERNIKVEISKRKILPVSYELRNFYGVDLKVMKIEDAFATKILACLTRKRTAYRDFYDVYFYLTKGVRFNEEVVKAQMGKSSEAVLEKLISFVKKKVSNKDVLNSIGELISSKKKDWIRQTFKEDLVGKLSFYRDNL